MGFDDSVKERRARELGNALFDILPSAFKSRPEAWEVMFKLIRQPEYVVLLAEEYDALLEEGERYRHETEESGYEE